MSPYLPREGAETFSSWCWCLAPRHRIDTYLPLEGPETDKTWLFQKFHLCIATYQPREGPETFL